jgi:hypothetical protein
VHEVTSRSCSSWFEKQAPRFESTTTLFFGKPRSSGAPASAGLLALLQPIVPDSGKAVHGNAIVLASDVNYIPPMSPDESRWSINRLAGKWDGKWDAAATRFLLVTMPHEQTHATQNAIHPKLPRWFMEGHAQWAGLHVTEIVRPELSNEERSSAEKAFRAPTKPRLSAWGSPRVKQEAFDRQLSAEDKARRKEDPTYYPPRPFHFGPDDIEQDMSEEPGRYGAALALFEGLEHRHGIRKVQTWIVAVLNSVDSGEIVPLGQRSLVRTYPRFSINGSCTQRRRSIAHMGCTYRYRGLRFRVLMQLQHLNPVKAPFGMCSGSTLKRGREGVAPGSQASASDFGYTKPSHRYASGTTKYDTRLR